MIVNKISDYERFDIIVFKLSDTNYIKRIIGLPGDEIAYHNNRLYINGKAYEEPYLENLTEDSKLTQNFTLKELTGKEAIPKGYFFVLGDNRLTSKDSRHAQIGLVPIETVLGKATLRVSPVKNLEIVK